MAINGGFKGRMACREAGISGLADAMPVTGGDGSGGIAAAISHNLA
jgi:hypothetical protein